MTSETALRQLQQALDLTGLMHALADAENWSGLPKLQQQRAELLAAVFPLDAAGDIEKIRPLLEQLIEQNHSLEQKCRQAQQCLQIELQGLNKNKKAVAAYHAS